MWAGESPSVEKFVGIAGHVDGWGKVRRWASKEADGKQGPKQKRG